MRRFAVTFEDKDFGKTYVYKLLARNAELAARAADVRYATFLESQDCDPPIGGVTILSIEEI